MIGALPFLNNASASAREEKEESQEWKVKRGKSREESQESRGESQESRVEREWLDDYSKPVGLTYSAQATLNAAYLWRGLYVGAANLQASASVGYGLVLVLFLAARARGRDAVSVFKRTIPNSQVMDAMTVAGIVLGLAVSLVQQKFGIVRIGGDSFLFDAYPVVVEVWDVVGVVGANGAGKSTLLRLLAGID